jgi:hypothetical protein
VIGLAIMKLKEPSLSIPSSRQLSIVLPTMLNVVEYIFTVTVTPNAINKVNEQVSVHDIFNIHEVE